MEPIQVQYNYLDLATEEIPLDDRAYIEKTLNTNLKELLPEIKEAGVYLKIDVAADGSITHTHFMNCTVELLKKIEDSISE